MCKLWSMNVCSPICWLLLYFNFKLFSWYFYSVQCISFKWTASSLAVEQGHLKFLARVLICFTFSKKRAFRNLLSVHLLSWYWILYIIYKCRMKFINRSKNYDYTIYTICGAEKIGPEYHISQSKNCKCMLYNKCRLISA